jgi:hypothetical protein
MTKPASKIRFSAKLLRPEATAKVGSWTFLTLPKNASAKLPSRGKTTVEGTINGFPFRATLEPDGQKSHWLKVNRKMRETAGADTGDVVTIEIAPVERNRSRECLQICGELLRPRRRRGRCGPTSRPLRAEIGSIGSPPPSGRRLARVGSTMPARCSLPGNDAFAASIGLAFIVKASALPRRQFR